MPQAVGMLLMKVPRIASWLMSTLNPQLVTFLSILLVVFYVGHACVTCMML